MRLDKPKTDNRILNNVNKEVSAIITTKRYEVPAITQSKEDKLNMLLDSIDSVRTNEDGSVYIKFKEHVIIETKGSFIKFSTEGDIIDSAKMIHLNPKIDTSLGREALATIANITNEIVSK